MMRNELEDFLGTNIDATAIKGKNIQHSSLYREENDRLQDVVVQHVGDIRW